MTARRLPATRATVATAGRGADDEYLRPCALDPLPFDLVLDHTRGPEHRAAVKACKAICGGCEVHETCLRDNFTHPSVVGGLTMQERNVGSTRPSCGSVRGYRTHLRHGEPTCQLCRDAATADERKRRAAA